MLERLPESTGLRYDETAGRRIIIRRTRRDPLTLLSEYYAAAETVWSEPRD